MTAPPFEKTKQRQAVALGRDRQVFDAAVTALQAADKYDYSYLWSWMGVPIIQLPADVMATQEVIWATKPDVIIETGVARGGSVLFMASLLELIGKGNVIGVDLDIRAHNRNSIERHPMAKRVVLIEGPIDGPGRGGQGEGGDPGRCVRDGGLGFGPQPRSRARRAAKLCPLVTEGCYLVVADTLLAARCRTSAAQSLQAMAQGGRTAERARSLSQGN